MYPNATDPTPKERAQTIGYSALLLLIVLITFSRAFGSELVFDSHFIISEDPRLKEFSVMRIGQILSENYWWPTIYSNVYRPVATLLLALQYSVLGFGTEPQGYQLINSGLHAGTVLMGFGLLRKLGVSSGWAFAASAWFAVHPYVTEVVPNIVGISDILAFMAILAGMHVYLDVLERRRSLGKGMALFGLVALAGVFSKENAVSLIALVVWHGCTLGRERILAGYRSAWVRPRHWAGLGVLLVAVGLAVLIPRFVFQEVNSSSGDPVIADNPLRGASWSDARINALAILGSNMVNCVVPNTLSADYSYGQIELATFPPRSSWDWSVFAKASGVLALGVVGLACFRKKAVVSFSIGAVFINALPTANVILLIGTIRADRLVYPVILPVIVMIGLGVWLGWQKLSVLLDERLRTSLERGAKGGVAFGVLMLATICNLRATDWRTHRALWKATHETSPGSYKAKLAWAGASGKSDTSIDDDIALMREAKAQLLASPIKSVRENETPDEFLAFRLIGRARVRLDEGRREEAEADLREAEEIWRRMLAEKEARGGVLKQKYGDSEAGRLQLKLDGLLVSLSEILRYFKQSEEAARILKKYRNGNELTKVYLKALARAEVEAGQWQDGLKGLIQVVVIHPDDVDTSREAAWVLAHHELPPSAQVFAPGKAEGAQVMPLLNLSDPELQEVATRAVGELLDVLHREKRELEHAAVRRQVALRLDRPQWIKSE